MKTIKQILKESAKFQHTERVWQLPFFAAFGVAIILSAAAYYERLDYGLVSMIGLMAFLYVPNTPMYHRMAVVMCCSFGLSLSFLLGLITHLLPESAPFMLAFVAMSSSILVRYYDLGSPGYFFFVFAALLGSFFPFQINDFIFLTGLVCIGGIVANLMAFLYSLSIIYLFKNSLPKAVPPRGYLGFEIVIVDSLIMGFFVGFALFLGQFLVLERSYWVAVSTAVIMQGITLNSVWVKQIQRIFGTVIGVAFAWFLLEIQFTNWQFIFLMAILVFITEWIVVRNYALALIFLTPYVTYLAEATSFMKYNANLLMRARLEDVIIGSILGLIGGFVIYKRKLRAPFEILARSIFRIKFEENK